MDDLGVPLFQETSMWWHALYLRCVVYTCRVYWRQQWYCNANLQETMFFNVNEETHQHHQNTSKTPFHHVFQCLNGEISYTYCLFWKVHHNSFCQIDPQLPANRCFYQIKLLCFSVRPLWFTTISAQKLLVDIIWYVKSVGGLEHFLFFHILEIIIRRYTTNQVKPVGQVGIPRKFWCPHWAMTDPPLIKGDLWTSNVRNTRDLHEISGRSGMHDISPWLLLLSVLYIYTFIIVSL